MARLRHQEERVDPACLHKSLGWQDSAVQFPSEKKARVEVKEVIATGIERMLRYVNGQVDLDSDFNWLLRGKDLWLHGCDQWPSDDWFESKHCRVLSVGLRAMAPVFRDEMRPTNDILRFLERGISSIAYSPSKEEWDGLLSQESISVSVNDYGFIPLKWKNHVLGRGLIQKGNLKGEIPGVRRRWLKKVFTPSDS